MSDDVGWKCWLLVWGDDGGGEAVPGAAVAGDGGVVLIGYFDGAPAGVVVEVEELGDGR